MTKLILPRRGFITGLVSLIAAPAIVKYASIMPVKAEIIKPDFTIPAWKIHFGICDKEGKILYCRLDDGSVISNPDNVVFFRNREITVNVGDPPQIVRAI